MKETVPDARGERDFAPLFTWRSAVCDSSLKPTTRHVLLTLSLHMNERGGSCFPSVDLLSTETGLNRATVIRQLQVARDNGWLVIAQSRGRASNRYTAVVPPDDQPSRKTTVAENDGRTVRQSHTTTVAVDESNRRSDEPQPSFSVRPTVAEDDPSSSIGLQRSSSRALQAFDEFWSSYPRRIGKGAALRAFEKVAKKHNTDDVIAAARSWAEYWDRHATEMQFIPHPSTWLNRLGWLDEIPVNEKPVTRSERNSAAAATVASLLTGSNLLGIGAGS